MDAQVIPQLNIPQEVNKLAHVAKQQAVATLVAAIIAKSKKALTLADIERIRTDMSHLLFPAPNQPAYKEWQAATEERMGKAYP
jgi:hypothetical protein